MSEALGYPVLRAVASHYRQYPDTWTTGAGSLHPKIKDGYKWQPGDKGCIDTMVLYFGAKLGGKMQVKAATKVLCEHHGLKVARGSIHSFNDSRCGSVERAIEFVEAPFAKPVSAKTTDASSELKKPTHTKELVAAAVLLFFSVLLTTPTA